MSECRDCLLCHDHFVADRAVTACCETCLRTCRVHRRIFYSSVSCRRDRCSRNGVITSAALLIRLFTRNRAGRRYSGSFDCMIIMSECRDYLLCHDHFVAHGAVASCCKASFRACRIHCRVFHNCMPCRRDRCCLLIRKRLSLEGHGCSIGHRSRCFTGWCQCLLRRNGRIHCSNRSCSFECECCGSGGMVVRPGPYRARICVVDGSIDCIALDGGDCRRPSGEDVCFSICSTVHRCGSVISRNRTVRDCCVGFENSAVCILPRNCIVPDDSFINRSVGHIFCDFRQFRRPPDKRVRILSSRFLGRSLACVFRHCSGTDFIRSQDRTVVVFPCNGVFRHILLPLCIQCEVCGQNNGLLIRIRRTGAVRFSIPTCKNVSVSRKGILLQFPARGTQGLTAHRSRALVGVEGNGVRVAGFPFVMGRTIEIGRSGRRTGSVRI